MLVLVLALTSRDFRVGFRLLLSSAILKRASNGVGAVRKTDLSNSIPNSIPNSILTLILILILTSILTLIVSTLTSSAFVPNVHPGRKCQIRPCSTRTAAARGRPCDERSSSRPMRICRPYAAAAAAAAVDGLQFHFFQRASLSPSCRRWQRRLRRLQRHRESPCARWRPICESELRDRFRSPAKGSLLPLCRRPHGRHRRLRGPVAGPISFLGSHHGHGHGHVHGHVHGFRLGLFLPRWRDFRKTEAWSDCFRRRHPCFVDHAVCRSMQSQSLIWMLSTNRPMPAASAAGEKPCPAQRSRTSETH